MWGLCSEWHSAGGEVGVGAVISSSKAALYQNELDKEGGILKY